LILILSLAPAPLCPSESQHNRPQEADRRGIVNRNEDSVKKKKEGWLVSPTGQTSPHIP